MQRSPSQDVANGFLGQIGSISLAMPGNCGNGTRRDMNGYADGVSRRCCRALGWRRRPHAVYGG